MKRLLIIIIVTLQLFSCRHEKDFSKNINEYYALGFPEIDKKWTNQDLENSINSIEKLKAQDNYALPKLASEKSSKYIVKILDELPKVDKNDSLDFNRQFQKLSIFHNAITKLLFAYGTTEKLQIYYSDEAIELQKISVLEATNAAQLYQIMMSQMTNETRAHLKKNDEKFQNGLFNVFEASLESHEAFYKYNVDDKIELAQVISENILKIWQNIDSKYKEKLKLRIKSLSKKNELKEVRKIYSKVSAEIK
jgi:hypothetical protein